MSAGAQEVWYAQQALALSRGSDPAPVRLEAARDARARYRRVLELARAGDPDCRREAQRLVGDPATLADLQFDQVIPLAVLSGPELLGAYIASQLGLDDRLRLHNLVTDDAFLPRLEQDILAEASQLGRREVVERFVGSARPETAAEAHRLVGHFLAGDLTVLLARLSSGEFCVDEQLDSSVAAWLDDQSTEGSDVRARITQLAGQIVISRAGLVGTRHLVSLQSLFANHVLELAQWHLRAEHLCRRAEAWIAEEGHRSPATAAALTAEIQRIRAHGRTWATTYAMLPPGAAVLHGPGTAAQLPAGAPCPYCFTWYVPRARFCSQCGAERGTLPSMPKAYVAATSAAAPPLSAAAFSSAAATPTPRAATPGPATPPPGVDVNPAMASAARLLTSHLDRAASAARQFGTTTPKAPKAVCDGSGQPPASQRRYSGACSVCGTVVPVTKDGLTLEHRARAR